MKKTICCVLLLLGLPLLRGAPASGFKAEFDRANRLYEEGRYSDSLAAYNRLAAAISHWKIFYNRGNCHYRLGRFLEAKIDYLEARKLNPVDAPIGHNIAIVNRHFQDAIPPEKTGFLTDLRNRLEYGISINLLNLILLLLWAGLNGLLWVRLKRGRSKTLHYALASLLLLTLALFLYQWQRVSRTQEQQTAVVTAPEAELLSGPGEGNTVLFKVHAGLQVRILERNRDWVQVSASAQVAGWIAQERLHPI